MKYFYRGNLVESNILDHWLQQQKPTSGQGVRSSLSGPVGTVRLAIITARRTLLFASKVVKVQKYEGIERNRIVLQNKDYLFRGGFNFGTPIEIDRHDDVIQITVGDQSSQHKVSRVKNHGNILPTIDMKGKLVHNLGAKVTVSYSEGLIEITPLPQERLDLAPGSFGVKESNDEVSEHDDGAFTEQLSDEASKADDEGYFDPKTLEDERERKLREIVQRRGQPVFRRKLLFAYEGCCAITGCDAASALEAAHISPYRGPDSNHVTNGVLLRADIHTLFDLGLLGVDPNSLAVVLDEKLEGTCYQEFDGQKLAIPDDSQLSPNVEALQSRWEQFKAK